MKRVAAVLAAGVFAAFTTACSQTDAGITTKIKAQYASDDLVKAHEINVDTQNHIVTLKGEVQSMAAKDQAVRLARATKGVTDVVDQLQIDATAATSGMDIDRHNGDVDVHMSPDLKQGAENTGNAVERGLDKTGNAIKHGAEATGDAVKRGAEATKEGAEKAGRAVKGAVTDKDHDSDHDGH